MNAKPEPRTITRMVGTTPEEDAQILAHALPGEAPAVSYRRLALSGGAPVLDFDPRIVEVTVRSPGGVIDGVVGVFAALAGGGGAPRCTTPPVLHCPLAGRSRRKGARTRGAGQDPA